MTLWEAIILGFVQGAAEFLPVSSSGHLVMAQAVMDIEIPGIAFEIAVHVATLVSILLVYRSRVVELTRGAVTGDRSSWEYIGLLVVATIPAGLIGVFAKDQIEVLFDDPIVPGFALLVTGGLLWSSRSALSRAVAERPTWAAAAVIGFAQAFALVPGISRSGSTVVAAMWVGVAPVEAAAFSFLMAVPAIAGAAVLSIGDLAEGSGLSTGVIVAGSIAAALTGILAIRTFVAMLARRSFHYFAPYCWAVGIAYLIFLAVR